MVAYQFSYLLFGALKNLTSNEYFSAIDILIIVKPESDCPRIIFATFLSISELTRLVKFVFDVIHVYFLLAWYLKLYEISSPQKTWMVNRSAPPYHQLNLLFTIINFYWLFQSACLPWNWWWALPTCFIPHANSHSSSFVVVKKLALFIT